ncbi:MAG: VCBS repeat-containing protein, partial [Nitrospira sp.]|nr:VCBS repeat-containing protein [Nitrospira sp.]
MRTIRRLPFIFILVLGTALMFMLGSPSMAKETDTDSPIGGVGGAVHADPFTGMATTSIPIDVVPGRNGVQPNLALTYASAGGNGWVGMGWKLEVGAIERQTRWGVPYLPTASDEQAGRVYTIRVNGVSADLVPAPSPASSDEYRAKIEGGFLRVKKLSGGSAGWEVTDKTGKKYLFGTTSSTRMSDPADATRIFKWCLERVEDRDGNFMTVAYAGDQGQAYLDHIDYTGNGATAPTNTVKFYLENRSDAPAMYLGNYLIKTAKRLKTIEVRANSALVRAYALTYSQSTSTSNSILVSIQQTGKDALIDASGAVSGGSVLPAITMGVSSALSNFSNATWSSFGSGGGDLRDRMLVGDFNGDGRNDLAFHAPWMGQILVGISTGTSLSWSAWAGAGTTDLMGRWLVGDFNGDGKSDLTYHDPWGGQLNVFISTGSTFGSAQWGNAGATELKGRWLV